MNRYFKNKKYSFLIVLLLCLLLLSATSVHSRQDGESGADSEVIPLPLGLYGSADSSAAYGMAVALQDMAVLDNFQAPDGQAYYFVPLISDNPADLNGVVAVFASEPITDAAAFDGMPVFVLAPDAPLITGFFFRGMASTAYQDDMLAEYMVNDNAVTSVAIVADGDLYAEHIINFSDSLTGRNSAITILPIVSAIPEDAQVLEMLAAQVVAYRGDASNASALLDRLVANGWRGVFVTDDVQNLLNSGQITRYPDIQFVGTTSWTASADDSLSEAFILSYVARTGEVPDAEAMAAYDLTWVMRLMVERAGASPVDIAGALPSTRVINTTSGLVNPADYGGQELYRNVYVYAYQDPGGATILQHYENGQVASDEEPFVATTPTPTMTLSPTPEAVTLTVSVNSLNVRTGPGLNYDIVTSIARGTQLPVFGTIPDFSWFYIQTDRGLGWVAAQYVTLFDPDPAGLGMAALPQIPPPPTPTPVPFTPTPTTGPDLVIQDIALSPNPPVVGQNFVASVTVQNVGGTDAGPFELSATWQPGDVSSGGNVDWLPAGTTHTFNLNVTLASTGPATIPIVVDPGNAVVEEDEGNNTFTFSYVVDAPTVVNTTGVFPAGFINFAGGNNDVDWTGAAFNAVGPATLGVIIGVPYNNVHAGMLTSGAISTPGINSFSNGTVFGIRTSDGYCGVARIDSIVGAQVTLSYRMYAPGDCPA